VTEVADGQTRQNEKSHGMNTVQVEYTRKKTAAREGADLQRAEWPGVEAGMMQRVHHSSK
jgi:hypothetical protein